MVHNTRRSAGGPGVSSDRDSDQAGGTGWIRYAGLGAELAGAVAGLTLLGYWVDRHFGSGPWGTLIGLACGLIGGLYNLVRESLRALHPARKPPGDADEDGGE